MIDAGSGASDAPRARLLSGVAHSVLAHHFLSAADEDSARDQFRIADNCFAGLDPATLAGDSLAAQYYIDALERFGRRDEVVKFLLEAPLAILPQAIYLQFAWVLIASGDDKNGERILEVASQRAGGNAGELRKLAGLHARLERSAQASRYYFEAAELFLKHHDLDNALEACTHALRHDQDNPHIRFLKCRLLVDKEKFDEAHRELRELCRDLPEPATRLLLAEVLLHSENCGSALVEIDGVLHEQPRHLETLIARARTLNLMNNFDDALKAAEEASEVAPGEQAPAIEKIIALRGSNQPREALAVADEILARHPSSPDAQNAKLDILLALEMWKDAIQVASDIRGRPDRCGPPQAGPGLHGIRQSRRSTLRPRRNL